MSQSLSDYYKNVWSHTQGLQMSDQMANLGYSWVSSLPKGLCLDVGCGDGTNGLKLSQLKFKVLGCDISKSAVTKAKQKGLEVKVVNLNLPRWPYPSKSFDMVWMTDVIEHVFWPETLIKKIHEVLKKGGCLFLTTPNVSWYINRLQLLAGKTLYDIHPEHIHWFNKERLVSILTNQGFEIVKFSSYLRVFPYPLTEKIKLLKSLDRVGPPNKLFSYTFAVLGKKL